MLGADISYDRTAFFYTDQHELSMEYVEPVEPGMAKDLVVRGDIESEQFAVFSRRGGAVAAGMHVNQWDIIDPLRALVDARRPGVDRGRLADLGTPLDQVWP